MKQCRIFNNPKSHIFVLRIQNCRVFEAGKLPIAAPPPPCSDWLIESKCSAATAQEFAAWTLIFQRRARGGGRSWFLTACRCGHLSPQIWDSPRKETVTVLGDTRLSTSKTVKVTVGQGGNILSSKCRRSKTENSYFTEWNHFFRNFYCMWWFLNFLLFGNMHWKLPSMYTVRCDELKLTLGNLFLCYLIGIFSRRSWK